MLLVTGFEPFGGRRQNSSAQLLEFIQRRSPTVIAQGRRIETVLLPVSYARVPGLLAEALERVKPERVVCLGEAASAQAIRLEEVAVNLDASTKPDNDGLVRENSIILSRALPSLASGLKLDDMELELRLAGLPTERSRDAGAYLCNHVFFRVRNFMPRAGFVHLPLELPPSWFEPLWRAIVYAS